MSTGLVPFDFNQLPTTQLGTDDQLAELSRGTSFLGRMQLFTKGAPIDEGKIAPGHFGIPEQDGKVTDLGIDTDIIALARRPKALDMTDKDAITVNYDPASDEFKRIAALASAGSNSGCKYGTSFLVYERKSGRFLELFLGNKSDRPVAGEIAPFMARTAGDIEAMTARGINTDGMTPRGPEALTLKVRLAKSKKGFSWHVPEVQRCSLPLELPALPKVIEEINRFFKTDGDGVEKVQDDGKKSRAR